MDFDKTFKEIIEAGKTIKAQKIKSVSIGDKIEFPTGAWLMIETARFHLNRKDPLVFLDIEYQSADGKKVSNKGISAQELSQWIEKELK